MAEHDAIHPIDLQVGAAIRVRRKLVGISQEKLADALGLTFQQVQKYERGTNRVSASKLFLIAAALDTDVAFFFQGIQATGPQLGGANASGELLALLSQKGGVTLSRLYVAMRPGQQLALVHLAQDIVQLTAERVDDGDHVPAPARLQVA